MVLPPCSSSATLTSSPGEDWSQLLPIAMRCAASVASNMRDAACRNLVSLFSPSPEDGSKAAGGNRLAVAGSRKAGLLDLERMQVGTQRPRHCSQFGVVAA